MMKKFERIPTPAASPYAAFVEDHKTETILNMIPDGIWVCDGSGKILIINRASATLNQIDAAEYVGRQVHEAVREGLMDRSVTLDVLKRKCQVSIMQYVKATDKHLLVTGTPAFDASGAISLVVVNERDITQLNAAKLALENARQVGEKFRDEINVLNLLELRSNAIVAESPKMREILRTALKLATQEVSNILLLAESGAGKNVLAKFIHQQSPRAKASFIHINCAALPESLLEAELFGYEKGAFTGAAEKGKAGLFELADGGTLFLDEIGDMPPPIQAKLLTYLDDKVIMRLGGVTPMKVDCSVIAATNKDLSSLVARKKFRLDLFYRLNSFTLRIPPLRERREDILSLTQHFLNRYNEAYGCRKKISAAAFERLQRHVFPGNVRELKNIIKKAVVLSESPSLENQILCSLESELTDPDSRCLPKPPPSKAQTLDAQLAALEKSILVDAISRLKTTRKVAAFLGTSQSSVMRRLKKHGLKMNGGTRRSS